MTFEELLPIWRLEYWAYIAAAYQDENASRLLDTTAAPAFYDYLTQHCTSRYILSAHGIGRDVEA